MKTIQSWKDITTRQYIALYHLETKEQPKILSPDASFTDIMENELDWSEYNFKRLAVIYDISYDDVLNINRDELPRIESELEFMKTLPSQTDFKKEIVINGVKYIAKDDLLSSTLGEWADIDYYNRDLINNTHKVMSVFYRKEGINRYDQAEADIAAELFLDVDVETTLAAFFLYFLLAANYIPSDIKDISLFQKMEMEVKKAKVKKYLTKGKHLLTKDAKTKKKHRQNYSG